MKCIIAFIALILVSCEVKIKTDKPEAQSKIRNGINLKSKGLAVSQAFLMLEDGTLVPEENKVQVNQRVYLKLLVDGWKIDNHKFYPDASMQIATSDGVIILNEDNLYKKEYPDGVEVEKDNFVILNAIITKLDKLYDYFLVSFRVWDRKSNGEITGSYKLYF